MVLVLQVYVSPIIIPIILSIKKSCTCTWFLFCKSVGYCAHIASKQNADSQEDVDVNVESHPQELEKIDELVDVTKDMDASLKNLWNKWVKIMQ